MKTKLTVLLTLIFVVGTVCNAQEPNAERGKKLLEETAYIPAFWPTAAYNRVWRQWNVAEKPNEYAEVVAKRYGLHKAPYDNDGLPMGLRKANYLFNTGIGIDCLTCHGGSIMGQSIVGLGNSTLDIHALFDEMAKAAGNPIRPPFQFSQVRGTSEAGAFSVYLLGLRNDDLTGASKPRDLGLHDDAVEDVPAWWLLKKKKTMYYTGATPADSVRSLMQFMMHPLTLPSQFEKAEPDFRDIQKYLQSIEPPKYPFAIDAEKARRGEQLFLDNCAKCHGTYGPDWTYPNRIIPLDEIGTDPKRYENIGQSFGEAYNKSWFAKETPAKPVRPTVGYQAPPLDGIWATAPYFHNGSVPTIWNALDSKSRPKRFTRSFETNEADYDKQHIGWKIRKVSESDIPSTAIDRRKIYDTSQPGRSNAGHTYGDNLSNEERWELLEYLKNL